MKRKRRIDKFKVASAVLSLAIVGALMFGIISVINNVKHNAKSKYNVVDLENNRQQETQESQQPSTEKNDVAYEPEMPTQPQTVEEAPTKVNVEQPSTVATPVPTPQEVISPSSGRAEFSFKENDILEWPVKGELVLKYSMDSTIYFETLNQYKCNPSISIRAEVGTQVKAAASGKVIKVTENEETGKTVVMDIGNGYSLTYGQLDGILAKEGTVCMAGEAIGTVAEPTEYYKLEGANLYFAMEKDGKSVDPTVFLAE